MNTLGCQERENRTHATILRSYMLNYVEKNGVCSTRHSERNQPSQAPKQACAHNYVFTFFLAGIKFFSKSRGEKLFVHGTIFGGTCKIICHNIPRSIPTSTGKQSDDSDDTILQGTYRRRTRSASDRRSRLTDEYKTEKTTTNYDCSATAVAVAAVSSPSTDSLSSLPA